MNLRVRRDLEFFPFDGEVVHVYDPLAKRHFKMGGQEISWLRHVDGSRSLPELKELIPHEHFDDFINNLNRMALIEGEPRRRRFDPLKIKFPLIKPNRFLDGNVSSCVLYRQLITIFSLPLAVINALLLILVWPGLQSSLLTLRFGWATVVAYLLALIVIGFIHEFSHAIVAKSRGANVPVIGMMFFYFQPAFFADISGIGLLGNRWHRIEALLAGVQANNFLITASFFLFFLLRDTSLAGFLAFAILLNAFLTLINFIPFVEYDGYYVFLELLGDSQFGHSARRSLRDAAFRKTEYVLYFVLSQALAIALVFTAVLSLRGLALRFWTSPVIDYLSLLLMLLGYLAVALRTARGRPLSI